MSSDALGIGDMLLDLVRMLEDCVSLLSSGLKTLSDLVEGCLGRFCLILH